MFPRANRPLCVAVLLAFAAMPARADDDARLVSLEASYRFLVSDRAQGGVLYQASAGRLKGRVLPLSFYDTADYWARHVCRFPSGFCAVTDTYDAATYTLEPLQGEAGDLQTERVNIHNGTNIYDAATWQIAVTLGAARNGFGSARYVDAYKLADGQNLALQLGYSGNAAHVVAGANRGVSAGERFIYNGTTVSRPEQAYVFRMLGRAWLNADPFAGTRYASLITVRNLPAGNSFYVPGSITWTDWKPFTGENAWAFLIGPLQAAYIHFVDDNKGSHIPLDSIAVRNALAVLPTFSLMQSSLGGVYYAPAGTVRNQGAELVNPYEIAVENNASLLAGLQILRNVLQLVLQHDDDVSHADESAINEALARIDVMINGGTFADGRTTAGLLAFFRRHAWRDGEFVQGGIASGAPAVDNAAPVSWQPTLSPKAVDANTWTVAALGARRIDAWFGFGASFRLWQQVKRWGAYGRGGALQGVGFSDQDGNGIRDDGMYRNGVMSAEWTAGAVNMVRNLIAHYAAVTADSADHAQARAFVAALRRDEASMTDALQALRYDIYAGADFDGKPHDYHRLVPQFALPYVYASRRYLVPFGWYANPLPSTCATAWMIMLANDFDPLGVGGRPN